MKLVILIASLAALAFPSLAADISGSWTISRALMGNTITNMKCEFSQDGAALSGICGGTRINGSIEADKVNFTFWPQVPNAYTAEETYRGTLDAANSSIKGEVVAMDVKGTFSATKDSAGAPASSAGKDISGSWRIIGDVVGNAIDMTCALKADGAKLSGTCTYKDLGDSPTTGSVEGNKVTLQNSVTREQLYDLTYNGTLDSAGTAMKGDIAVAGVTGDFTATKNK